MSDPVPISEVLADVMEKHAVVPTLTVHFDGACEPRNPGGVATYGWTVHDGEREIANGCGEVCRGPRATNNLAEWSALGFALRWILDHGDVLGPISLEMVGDSQLVVNQLRHEWACNKEHLQKLRARCEELIDQIKPCGWKVTWVPREQNEAADALSQAAYVKATGKKFPVRRK